MSKTNTRPKGQKTFTHEGAPAFAHMKPIQALRRSVLACLLWEDQFYEDGETIADRITTLCDKVSATELATLAVEARSVHNLRHVPLILLTELVKKSAGHVIGQAIFDTIQRPDEISEFVSLYWKDGKKPLTKQMKLGLGRAFGKFTEYSLAKHNQDSTVKLRDVLFMVHAKPGKVNTRGRKIPAIERKDYRRGEVKRHAGSLLEKLTTNTLTTPDTWEVALSGGADKKATFERLLEEGQLGYMALLKNLRNMTQVGVNGDLIIAALKARKGAERVFPFRYVAAARACPQLEPAIDEALQAAIMELPKLSGKTVVLVDVSGSMDDKLSGKSDMTRIDAAAALASLINGDLRVFTFSNKLIEVPARRGMAGVDVIQKSQPHGGTEMAKAIEFVNKKVPHDRIIVISDEQASTNGIPDPVAKLAYMINVASYKNGVGYGKWQHLDGFSEGVIRWIYATENDR